MKRLKILDLKVRDFMSTDLVTAEPEEPLSKIIGQMKSHDIHEIPIVKGKDLLGMATLMEIAKRRDLPPMTKVERIMSSPPEVEPDDDLPTAAEKMMGANMRALPVSKKKRLVGLISRTDLTRALAQVQEIEQIPIKDVMSSSPLCVGEDADISEARRIMASLHERAVPVVDKDRQLVGMIGLKDLTTFFARQKSKESKGEVVGRSGALKVKVSSLMRSPPVTLKPDGKFSDALRLMIKHDISAIVVIDGGAPLGLVTKADVLEVMTGFKERQELLVQISGLEEQPEIFEQMYEIIRKGMKRISGIITPKIFNIHVVTYKGDGDRTKWSLRCRFTTSSGMIYANHFDWDLYIALEGLLDQIETRIKKDKDKRVARRKKRPL